MTLLSINGAFVALKMKREKKKLLAKRTFVSYAVIVLLVVTMCFELMTAKLREGRVMLASLCHQEQGFLCQKSVYLRYHIIHLIVVQLLLFVIK